MLKTCNLLSCGYYLPNCSQFLCSSGLIVGIFSPLEDPLKEEKLIGINYIQRKRKVNLVLTGYKGGEAIKIPQPVISVPAT